MTILRSADNKIIRNASGAILKESPLIGSHSTILDITGNLQIPNRIFKDGNNNVKQITDAAQNIVFAQSDVAKQPIYNYGDTDSGGYPYFEFDGVNDFIEVVDVSKLQGQWENFTFECRVYIPVSAPAGYYPLLSDKLLNTNYGKFMSIITLLDDTLNIQFGSQNFGDTNLPLIRGIWNHFVIWRTPTNHFIAINGLLSDTGSSSIYPETPDTLLLGRYAKNTSDYLNGSIMSTQFYSHARYPVDLTISDIGSQVLNPKEPFTFLKRYKSDGNKKLFLSSRYLEGFVEGNEANETSKINSEVDGNYAIRATNGPYITSKGFDFDNTSITVRYFIENNIHTLGSNDWYFGAWLYATAANRAGIYGSPNFTNDWSFQISKAGTTNDLQLRFSSNGTSFDYALGTGVYLPVNTYFYLTVLRKNDTIYVFINGVLKFTLSLSLGYSIFQAVNKNNIGNAPVTAKGKWQGLMDDILFNVGDSIIDPTGYNVGEKVFQPPRRRSLDSQIIQFIK